MSSSLDALFNPRSIAILGASPDTTKLSGRPLGSLRRYHYAGKIYPVNPKYQDIDGTRCYPSVDAIHGEIDLAIIPVGLDQVGDVVEQCARRGVHAAIVLTSGFAETGTPEGIALQERLRKAAMSSGMRLVGPNSMGMVNFHNGAAANFSSSLFREDVQPGGVAFVSQSGALGAMLFDVAADLGIRYAGWISTGNETDVEYSECLLQLTHDPNVKVIGGYMEGLRDGPGFLRAASEAMAARKPLVLLKGGRSEAGSKAALSHTGALAGSAAVFDAVFEQFGVLGVDDPVELLDLLATFERCQLPRGSRAAIVTFSGGAGTIISDKCAQLGVEVPPLSDGLRARLDAALPRFGSSTNPIDLTAQIDGDPNILQRVLDVLRSAGEVDVVLVFLALLKRFPDELGSALKAFAPQKPLLATWMAPPGNIVRELTDAGVATFPDPIRMTKAAAGLCRYATWTRRPSPPAAPNEFPISKVQFPISNSSLTESEAKAVLRAAGLATARGQVVDTLGDARRVAENLGYPVVLKASSARILHKTDAGLVALNLASADAVTAAYEAIFPLARKLDQEAQVLIEEMLPKGLELALGVSRDPVFGAVLMIAMGGIAIEADPDRALALLPVHRRQAKDMLLRLRGYRRLQGIRGEPPYDVEAVIDAMLAVSSLASSVGDHLQELDINPLMVYAQGKGVRAADALIVQIEAAKVVL